ncbi:MAG: OmpA family protein [Bryobacteraceae bacterium]|nr:OmpA family protein [Bryobacterales bacterium]MEB2363999.1 OmpA family protein [Bryobacterales bacterium]NUN00623.1 OmpA family protein [Bryobacteraceae bacterium]
MFQRYLKLLVLFTSLCALVFAQGLQTNASKDDWEEINFEFNSAILSDGYPSLLRLAELLQQNPGYKVRLVGNADWIGGNRYNQKLGASRAEEVKRFLVKYGASAGQVETATQGEESPKVPNRTKEGRFMNRRVEVNVFDDQGRRVAAGGIKEAIDVIPDWAKKQQECCEEILKRLDRLDEIVSMLKDLGGVRADLEKLRKEHDDLRQQVAGLPKPLTRDETTQVARTATAEEIEKARMPRFSLSRLNFGVDDNRDLTFTGMGRYFAPFKDRFAVQAQGEYMYFRDRQEGQFDIGLVNRIHTRAQAGMFASFKHVTLREMQSGGTLGQASFTLDYLFSQGRAGVFASKGFMNDAIINRVALTRNVFEETYLSTVDQYGASTTLGLFGENYVEGNLGWLNSRGHGNRVGGTARFIFPISDRFAFTLEGGMNETLLARGNAGRVVAGFQFGNFIRPKDYLGVDHAVPADVPRIRYEMLTRRVRTGNDPPVADAGADQIGVPAGPIRLDASGSFDPEEDPITFQWSQVAGPAVTLSGMSSAVATFTAQEGQSYAFRVTVKDDKGAQSIDRVSVITRSAPQVQIARFAANPAAIDAGQTSTIEWRVLNATEVSITNLGRVDANAGTSTVSPADTTEYRLTAKNDTSEVSETITITVRRPEARFQTCTAQPMNIMQGESATLFWATQAADTVSISGLGNVEATGTRVVSPTESTTYIFTARNRYGETTCTVNVQVTEGQRPRILSFVANPAEITAGGTSALSWSVENATEVTIDGIGTVENSGSRDVQPQQTTTYTLRARNNTGEVTTTATVTVMPGPAQPPTLASCLATPSTITTPGAPVSLSWVAQNATGIAISPGGGAPPLAGPFTVNPQQTTTYTITATGGAGTTPATCQVTVTVQSQAPVPDIAGPDVIETIYRETTLDARGSTDPNDLPLTYIWEPLGTGVAILDQGQPVTRIQVGGLFGDYPIRLTVRNSAGQSATTTVTVRFKSSTVL